MNVRVEREDIGDVTATRKGLYIDGVKVRGLDMDEVREQMAAGKRAVVIWVKDDGEARKIRRYIRNRLDFSI